eukprot:TRINITY_DN8238_c0_g1_i1.p1 TRINITY_DN8238_c0_g1~~TRINITY_DN8238_c0_g1_i1.p1  ORF type:complete len:387 (-),score=76.13 TRINITY_DN8238_c0_g1_i1:31-1074(-)
MGVCGKDLIKDGWFSERGALWPGQAMSLQVTEVLYSGRSDFQDLLVFTNPTYGTVLVLDGVIQVTTRDEFAYQEMIAHLPLFAHPAPVDVLVIGGGDGGVLREVLKHPSVARAVLVEIDAAVVDASKRYLPALAAGFDDPRVEVVIADGAAYMDDHADAYDVIITDSSDPIGPAEVLFQPPFYAAMARCLRAGGSPAAKGSPCGCTSTSSVRCCRRAAACFQRLATPTRRCRPTRRAKLGLCFAPRRRGWRWRRPAAPRRPPCRGGCGITARRCTPHRLCCPNLHAAPWRGGRRRRGWQRRRRRRRQRRQVRRRPGGEWLAKGGGWGRRAARRKYKPTRPREEKKKN